MKTEKQGLGFPLPFGDSQYRLSLTADGQIQVERHHQVSHTLTIAEAREWYDASCEQSAQEDAAYEQAIRDIVREQHCSRRVAVESLDRRGYYAPQFALI